jgi:hypothetical protein
MHHWSAQDGEPASAFVSLFWALHSRINEVCNVESMKQRRKELRKLNPKKELDRIDLKMFNESMKLEARRNKPSYIQ